MFSISRFVPRRRSLYWSGAVLATVAVWWSRWRVILCVVFFLWFGTGVFAANSGDGALHPRTAKQLRRIEASHHHLRPAGTHIPKALRTTARYWTRIDRLVLEVLNQGGTLQDVQHRLDQVPGYVQSDATAGIVIGGRLSRGWSGAVQPAYAVLSPDGGTRTVLGIYGFSIGGSAFEQGRLSLYSRAGSRWYHADSTPVDLPLTTFPLAVRESRSSLAVIEAPPAADREEGALTLWDISSGRLKRGSKQFPGLVDFSAEVENDALVVRFTRFLPCIDQSISNGERLQVDLRVESASTETCIRQTVETPWLEVLAELYCRLASSSPARAAALFEQPPDMERLLHAYQAILTPQDRDPIRSNSGDIATGTAMIVIGNDTARARFEFRMIGKDWKISAVQYVEDSAPEEGVKR